MTEKKLVFFKKISKIRVYIKFERKKSIRK